MPRQSRRQVMPSTAKMVNTHEIDAPLIFQLSIAEGNPLKSVLHVEKTNIMVNR